MILDNIMGYWVTDHPLVLETFVAQAREQYLAMEQALEPLVATVRNLEGDWNPRWAYYWNAKLKELTVLRTANQAALQMFDKDQSSQTAPMPLIIAGTALGYRCAFHTIESEIEEAGILITSYIEVSESHKEQHIRQRQRVLKALQEVVKETRDAIGKGRTKLIEDTEQQQKLMTPQPTQRSKQKTTPASTTDDAEAAEVPPPLSERYAAVEQALEPIVAAVPMLEGPGKPRRKQYRDLKAALLTLRTKYAVVKAINTSETELLLAPPGIVERRCEEAINAVKTAHSPSDSDQEHSLQQRQHVLTALQTVVEVTRGAIRKGRAELGQAPQEQPALHVVHSSEEVR